MNGSVFNMRTKLGFFKVQDNPPHVNKALSFVVFSARWNSSFTQFDPYHWNSRTREEHGKMGQNKKRSVCCRAIAHTVNEKVAQPRNKSLNSSVLNFATVQHFLQSVRVPSFSALNFTSLFCVLCAGCRRGWRRHKQCAKELLAFEAEAINTLFVVWDACAMEVIRH